MTVASNYKVAEFGGSCTGIENVPLVAKVECMRASALSNISFQREEEDAHYPRGCYLNSNGNVYWNIHETGKIRGDCAAICRKTRNNL